MPRPWREGYRPMLYVLVPFALVTCFLCRRHEVVLWGGGLFAVLAVLSLMRTLAAGANVHGEDWEMGFWLSMALITAPLAAVGVILLVGGLVRLCPRRRSR